LLPKKGEKAARGLICGW